MNGTECAFCLTLGAWTKRRAAENAEEVSSPSSARSARTAYVARLQFRKIINGDERRPFLAAGEFALRFCPECGRKIEPSELEDGAEEVGEGKSKY